MKNTQPKQWTASDVAYKLSTIGLGKYSDIFKSNNVNGKDIYSITPDELSEIGMTVVHREIYKTWIDSLPPLRAKTPKIKKRLALINNGRKIVLPESRLSNINTSRLNKLQTNTFNTNKNNSINNVDIKREIVEDENGIRFVCRCCGRRFAEERVSTHENICKNKSRIIRKKFDSQSQRLSYEALSFMRMCQDKNRDKLIKSRHDKYKIEHEKLLQAIRMAKGDSNFSIEVAELDIVLEERIECPHCNRKFGLENAEKHINSCNVGKGLKPPMYC